MLWINTKMKAKIKAILCTILALTMLFIFIVIALGKLPIIMKLCTTGFLALATYVVYCIFYKSFLEKSNGQP